MEELTTAVVRMENLTVNILFKLNLKMVSSFNKEAKGTMNLRKTQVLMN